MLDFLKKYLITGYLKFKDDRIVFGEDNLVFYFVPHLVYEAKGNRSIFGEDYGASMFLAGRNEGFDFFNKHGIPKNKSIAEVFAMSFDILRTFGWGKFRTLKVDEKKRFIVMVGTSTFANEYKKMYGKTETPIDFMIAGLTAGALRYLTKEQVYSVEVKCCAEENVKNCLFVTGTKDNILSYIKKYAEDRFDLASRLIEKIDDNEKKLV